MEAKAAYIELVSICGTMCPLSRGRPTGTKPRVACTRHLLFPKGTEAAQRLSQDPCVALSTASLVAAKSAELARKEGSLSHKAGVGSSQVWPPDHIRAFGKKNLLRPIFVDIFVVLPAKVTVQFLNHWVDFPNPAESWH